MIRYELAMDAWISGKNPDGQGFPTTNLEGDVDICTCDDCLTAYASHQGTNVDEVIKINTDLIAKYL